MLNRTIQHILKTTACMHFRLSLMIWRFVSLWYWNWFDCSVRSRIDNGRTTIFIDRMERLLQIALVCCHCHRTCFTIVILGVVLLRFLYHIFFFIRWWQFYSIVFFALLFTYHQKVFQIGNATWWFLEALKHERALYRLVHR